MSNDDELEIRLVTSLLDDGVEGRGEGLDVIGIEIGSWLVESNDL